MEEKIVIKSKHIFFDVLINNPHIKIKGKRKCKYCDKIIPSSSIAFKEAWSSGNEIRERRCHFCLSCVFNHIDKMEEDLKEGKKNVKLIKKTINDHPEIKMSMIAQGL